MEEITYITQSILDVQECLLTHANHSGIVTKKLIDSEKRLAEIVLLVSKFIDRDARDSLRNLLTNRLDIIDEYQDTLKDIQTDYRDLSNALLQITRILQQGIENDSSTLQR